MTYELELITATTVALIVIIMAVYLLVLRRNGWAGKSTNYQCTNPACKKTFQKPLEVTDSADSRLTHFVCPECGYDLSTLVSKKRLIFNKDSNLKSRHTLNLSRNKEQPSRIDETPLGCKFHFGYLFSLQKGSPFPHQCFECPKLIDCYRPLEKRMKNEPGGI